MTVQVESFFDPSEFAIGGTVENKTIHLVGEFVHGHHLPKEVVEQFAALAQEQKQGEANLQDKDITNILDSAANTIIDIADDIQMSEDELKAGLINSLCADVHEANKKWWTDLNTGEYPIKRNMGELLCLVHSEISEALEGARKNLPDDKLPHRPMVEVELADAIIRIFDIAAGHGMDLGGAYVEKMNFNATRADHSREERLKDNGKKF
jgi:hypothetical protein